MTEFRVLDEETARQLSGRIRGDDSVSFHSSREIFDGESRIVVAPSRGRREAIVIRCVRPAGEEHSDRSEPSAEKVQPKSPIPEAPHNERPQFIATGFLGLDDAPYEEEEEQPQAKAWWKRLLD